MKKNWKILVVDDEEVMRVSLAAWLAEDGYEVETAASGREAIAKAAAGEYAMYFVDLKMPPGIDGIETMMEIRRLRPDAAVIIITAYATVDTAITAMKEGAQEYIVKPCNPEEISLLVNRIIKVKNLQRENLILRKRLSRQYTLGDMVSKNARMQEVFALVREVADLRSTVLILGESGTGKELVARAIHSCGSRAPRPFVPVSCAALPETLLESELFGYEKGSFTGAGERKKGKFELAHGGTLFLDEIGDIPSKVQVDLLRVLQERRFFRLGGTEEVEVDVRVLAATSRNLRQAVQQGTFRDDLFYRLNVITVTLPPLRERREDIPLLVHMFIERLAVEVGKEVDEISDGALRVLLAHPWPGNVRELENAIERAIVTSHGHVLLPEDFAFLVRDSGQPTGWTPPIDQTLDAVEREVIIATLRRTGGNVKEAAAILDIDRSTLYDRLRRYGIRR
jgi:DNA-binding NtrC family response regulator